MYLLFTVCVCTCPGVSAIFLSRHFPLPIVLFHTLKNVAVDEDLIIFASRSRLTFSTSTPSRIALVCCLACELCCIFYLAGLHKTALQYPSCIHQEYYSNTQKHCFKIPNRTCRICLTTQTVFQSPSQAGLHFFTLTALQ